MAKNQRALKRYRIILRVLSRSGKHASKDIHIACENSGIEVQYRTIQQDLQDLMDDHTIFGIDLGIIYDQKEKKWYSDAIPKEIYSALELEKGEIDALLFYAKIINQYKDYPIFEEITQAIQKVFESSNISEETRNLFEAETLLETEKHQPLKGIELIANILDALHRHKVLQVAYQTFEGAEVKNHEIKPLLLKEDKQMWYVVGVNLKYDSLITLALDRIKLLVVSNDDFDPVDFNSEDYFKYSFGITVSEQEATEVVISFDPYQGNYLRTLPIHPTQKILNDTSKEFIIQIKVKPSYEFYSKIRSYGDQAKVLSPKYVAEQIKNSFIAAVNSYKSE